MSFWDQPIPIGSGEIALKEEGITSLLRISEEKINFQMPQNGY
jgi:hypothetical protein